MFVTENTSLTSVVYVLAHNNLLEEYPAAAVDVRTITGER